MSSTRNYNCRQSDNVFQVENIIIKKFENSQYGKINQFIKDAEKEDLLINMGRNYWIPKIIFNNNYIQFLEDMKFNFVLEIDTTSDLELIYERFKDCNISKIANYNSGNEKRIRKMFPKILIEKKEKNFEECTKLTKINGNFDIHNHNYYYFNKVFNSCWGKKIAVTNDNKIRPCIFSNIIIGNLEKEKVQILYKKIRKYWYLTKDKIEKCKNCELKYICFDCREIPFRKTGNLYATNPNCKYEPFNGKWE